MGELIGLVAVSAPFLMVLGIVWISKQSRIEKLRDLQELDKFDREHEAAR